MANPNDFFDLKKFRELTNISQQDLSVIMSVSRSTLSLEEVRTRTNTKSVIGSTIYFEMQCWLQDNEEKHLQQINEAMATVTDREIYETQKLDLLIEIAALEKKVRKEKQLFEAGFRLAGLAYHFSHNHVPEKEYVKLIMHHQIYKAEKLQYLHTPETVKTLELKLVLAKAQLAEVERLLDEL